jgi:hypothetical protein
VGHFAIERTEFFIGDIISAIYIVIDINAIKVGNPRPRPLHSRMIPL